MFKNVHFYLGNWGIKHLFARVGDTTTVPSVDEMVILPCGVKSEYFVVKERIFDYEKRLVYIRVEKIVSDIDI